MAYLSHFPDLLKKLKKFQKKFLKSVDKMGNLRYHINRCSEQELNKITNMCA